jgi:hypothetical protein
MLTCTEGCKGGGWEVSLGLQEALFGRETVTIAVGSEKF